jgi:hypothetical protein
MAGAEKETIECRRGNKSVSRFDTFLTWRLHASGPVLVSDFHEKSISGWLIYEINELHWATRPLATEAEGDLFQNELFCSLHRN